MTRRSTNGVVHHLHRAAKLSDVAGLTDGELLDHYVRDRDESAFAGLVHRHGQMVWGVCRRILGPSADAEDAFQATFLVLVRKAHSVSPSSRVGNWLYGVAHHTALKASAMNRKRRGKEAEHRRPDPAAERDESLVGLLDAELQKLPEKYRSPIVFCELEGRTIKEAARHLGWPEGTVAGRLARGREMLAKRLKARDVTLPAGALASALSAGTVAADVPSPLFESTIHAASAFAEGGTAAIPMKVVALTEGVIRAMFLTKLKVLSAAVTGVALLGTAAVYAPAAFSGGNPQKPLLKSAEKTSVRLEWRERLSIPHGRGHQVFSSAISPKGDVIAVGSSEGARVYDASTGKELMTGNRDISFTTAVSVDGKWFASGQTRESYIWDIASGKILFTADNAGQGNVSTVQYSSDGKWLSTSGKGVIFLHEADTGKMKKMLVPRNGPGMVYGSAFSPDSKRIVAAYGQSKNVIVWEIESGKMWKSINLSGMATDVKYAPDGQSIATASGDGLVTIWDLESEKPLAKIEWATGGRHSLAFSPDGTVLAAAGGGNNAVKLFDAKSGKELRTLEHTSNVKSVSYSADGLTLVTGGDDAVRVWEAKK